MPLPIHVYGIVHYTRCLLQEHGNSLVVNEYFCLILQLLPSPVNNIKLMYHSNVFTLVTSSDSNSILVNRSCRCDISSSNLLESLVMFETLVL